MKKFPFCLTVSIMSIGSLVCHGETTVGPNNSGEIYAYGANFGFVNLAGNVTNGVIISENFCSGYAYAANIGWIDFGDRTPANGVSYGNNSATDYGVNVSNYRNLSPGSQTADLRGYAYGANVGWIQFENTGNPRVDLTTGQLLGYAWSANLGWIRLGETGEAGRIVTVLAPGPDTDNDGIADAYEYTYAGFPNLSLLGGTPGKDFDGDGQSDLAEYLADTNPTDSGDLLRITSFTKSTFPSIFDLTFTTRPTRIYRVQANPDLTSPWTDVTGDIRPTGLTYSTTVADPGGDSLHFWRAKAILPLRP